MAPGMPGSPKGQEGRARGLYWVGSTMAARACTVSSEARIMRTTTCATTAPEMLHHELNKANNGKQGVPCSKPDIIMLEAHKGNPRKD